MKLKLILGIIAIAIVAIVILEIVVVGVSMLIFGGIIVIAGIAIALVLKSKSSGDDEG